MYDDFERAQGSSSSSEAPAPRPSTSRLLKRKRGDTVQLPLENFLNDEGDLLTSKRHRPNLSEAPIHNLPSVDQTEISFTTKSAEVTVVARRLVVDEVVKPPVSCLDPSTPRRDAPVGPYSWAKQWKYADGVGAYLSCEAVYDLEKAKLLDSRMLVSRKRTTNVFDLASTWRKQQISSLLAEDPVQGSAAINAEWSNNV